MRAHVFGDDVDTDIMIPGRYLSQSMDEMARHIFESLRPAFFQEVEHGDAIIAGRNFGCGSSREQAVLGLKFLGIGTIIAESFARIFFRNCISLGIPALTCKETTGQFKDKDPIGFSLKEGYIKNFRTGMIFTINPLPSFMTDIMEGGGIIASLKRKANLSFSSQEH